MTKEQAAEIATAKLAQLDNTVALLSRALAHGMGDEIHNGRIVYAICPACLEKGALLAEQLAAEMRDLLEHAKTQGSIEKP